MKKRNLVKGATSLIVSAGVGAVVRNAIIATTPPVVGIPVRILIGVGTAFVAWTVSDAASKYTEERIDTVVDSFTEAKTLIEEAKKETTED